MEPAWNMEFKTFSLCSLESPLWISTISRMCEKWPSSELVVLGMRLSSSKVNRYCLKYRRLLTAWRRFSCVQLLSPDWGWIVFSLRKSRYLSMYWYSLFSKVSPSVSWRLLDSAKSTAPASSSGFLVVPLMTKRSMCTWHIWKGMPEKAVRRPLNPSPVTDAMSYPSCSKNLRPSAYVLVVSASPKLHHRFSLRHWSRIAEAHQLESSVRSPNHSESATTLTLRGKCSCLGVWYESSWSLIVLLSRPCLSESSLRVCFSKTYSFQSSFSKCVFCLLSPLHFLWQSLQLYVCTPRSTPRFFVFPLPHEGQILCFFSHST